MNVSYDILSIITREERTCSWPSLTFWIVLSGSGEICSDSKKSFDIQPLDFLRLSPEESYTYIAREHTLIGAVFIDDYTSTQSFFTCIRSADNEQVKKAFLFAIDMQSADIPNKKAIMNSFAGLLWNIFLGIGIRHTPVMPLIEEIISLIIKNHRDPSFDLSALLRDFGYTPGHLRRLFKEQTGVTPHEFLILQRLDTAKKYIRESSEKLSIRKIADYCGYDDPNYFSKQFKNKEGMNPREYMQAVNNITSIS